MQVLLPEEGPADPYWVEVRTEGGRCGFVPRECLWRPSAREIAGGSGGSAAAAEVEGELRQIYGRYAPEMLPKVSSVLAKFAGREHELLQKVQAKYC